MTLAAGCAAFFALSFTANSCFTFATMASVTDLPLDIVGAVAAGYIVGRA